MIAAAAVSLTAVAVSALLVAHWRHRESAIRVAKPLASLGFVVLALSRFQAVSTVDRFLLAALLLGALGDVLLLGRRTFDAGLAAFLGGHLAYAAAFHLRAPWPSWSPGAAAVLALAAALITAWLWPHLGGRRLPVLAYVVVIAVMAWGAVSGASSGALPWFSAPAAVLFLVSDVTVARQKFMRPALANRLLGLPMYYSAQLLLALLLGR